MNPTTADQRDPRLWTRAWAALVDANPVFAKELLVTARAPVFVGSIIVAPLLLGALVVLVRMGMSDRFESDAGIRLFPVYFTGLALAVGTLGASLGSTVVVQEREAGALDALKFSSLSLRRIVVGKFAAVVLAEFAVVACTLPLLAFVLDLGGVSLGETAVAMAITLACGVLTASAGIATSAHVANTRRSLLVSLLASGAIGIGVAIWLGVGSDLVHSYQVFGVASGYFEAPVDSGYVAFLFVLPAYAVTTLLWLGYAAGISGLMDRSEDRSLPLKKWTVGALALGVVAFFCCVNVAETNDRGVWLGASMVATGLLAIALLFTFVGEPLGPTRRMQLQPPSRLVRALYPSCLAPSVLFTVVATGVVLLVMPAIVSGVPTVVEREAIWGVGCLSALGGAMGWVAARRGAAPARKIGAIALVGLVFLVALLHDDWRGASWVDGLCPLWLYSACGHRARTVELASLLGWSAAGLTSLGAMLRAVRARTRVRA
jgi:ABC-type transport system involved in cytochrome c biogenesis permease component